MVGDLIEVSAVFVVGLIVLAAMVGGLGLLFDRTKPPSPDRSDGSRWGNRIVATLATLAADGVVVLVVVVLPPALVASPPPNAAYADVAKAQNEVRNTLLTFVAALAGASAVGLGARVAYLTFRETQQQNQRTFQVTERGQFTDRFSKAVEQLGSDNLDVRIGAVYALEQIANDSKQLHWPIMQILCAFLRTRTIEWRSAQIIQAADPYAPVPLREDFQVAATVIGQRKVEQDPADKTLDLNGIALSVYRAGVLMSWLKGIDFDNAQLKGASFFGAQLERASFHGAQLQRANFGAARLGDAEFNGAQLHEADFTGAQVDGCDFTGATVDGAKFGFMVGRAPINLADKEAGEAERR